jgi:hypothetical protein
MASNELRFIRHSAEFCPKTDIRKIPKGTRGIYALLCKVKGEDKFRVVYIGMARNGVSGRLRAHNRSTRKNELWTHFSVYSVWPNITDDEIVELEGILRHIFRKDPDANVIAIQRGFKRLKRTQDDKFERKDEKPW